jgi:hypothetical protein
VTLSEAMQIADRVTPPDPDWPPVDGERVGIPFDCNVPMILNSTDGVARLRCCVCGLTLSLIARQWIVTEWGSRGIRLQSGSDSRVSNRRLPDAEHAPVSNTATEPASLSKPNPEGVL